jgi:Domain of Unknown Function (DUF928)
VEISIRLHIFMKKNRVQFQLKSALAASWAIVCLSSLLSPSLVRSPLGRAATPLQPSNNSGESIKVRFLPANPDPPDRGTPGSNRGTGSRGDCLYKQNKPPLTGLVGSQNLELTVSDRPTFWVYVPYTSQEAPSGKFSLQDGENNVYTTQFQLPATPGIVNISLPATQKPLEVGKTYRWYFEINCPRTEAAAQVTPASVTGVVRRVVPSAALNNALNAAKTPLQRVAAYAQYSIWYDTLTELARLRSNPGQNPGIEGNWVELLSDRNIGLQDFAKESIAGNVTTNSPPE